MRIQVTVAGVVMNLLLAWVLISIVFMIGLPQPIAENERSLYPDARIQILSVKPDTPAASMGLQPGDIILSLDNQKIETLEQVGEYIRAHKGKDITVKVSRFGKEMTIHGTPLATTKENEGSLGISYSLTATVKHTLLGSIKDGFVSTLTITGAIFAALGKMVVGLVTGQGGAGAEITGPVGIVYLTKQMSDLGIAYLLQFAALLSINLAIINILPIPALDGGRILFILIEKIKGRPLNQRVEGIIHQTGFILLLLLMLFVTIKDFVTFDILANIS